MTNRKILYGYQIQTGELVTCPEEVDTVRRVFDLYNAGASYQAVVDTLNSESVPFSEDAPLWNKHKVKRLLENPRYAGEKDYPAIIDENTFSTAMNLTAVKAEKRHPKEKKEHDVLWQHLTCAECGERLIRTGGGRIPSGYQYLRCKTCGASIRIPEVCLIERITTQILEHNAAQPQAAIYTPSAEAIRLANAINRGIEQPTAPEDVVTLILQGVSARYDCCSPDIEYEHNDRQTEVNWERFDQAVSHITISQENAVTVYFQSACHTGKDN